ncbi:uncharacterized protein LOC117109062 [Anneissia japonica]|uniref:uncharacterized protein LOC117109062 n=1 Tax=Anneissia japonica TaxID=1529436 RepID=UPI0014258B77|nr:uncharacterized protein LOC117109062 [Anneissia japonica]
MGSTDSIPIVSQVKSLVQVISGDAEGAKRTQENFLHTAPVLSQITSVIQAIEGDTDGAKKTQQEFVESLGHFADGIPVVGHIKGVIEYATGHKAAGDASMKAASRTIGVLAGGAAGFFVGGPAGAFLGGVAAGAAMDGIITGVDSAVHHQYSPYGEVSIVTNMVNGHYDPGEEFDFAAGIGFDGLAGLEEAGEGSVTQTISEHVTGKPIYRVLNDNAALEAIQNQALPPPYMGGEVWIAESTEHSRAFTSGGAANRTNVLQIKIDKGWYTKMRDENLVHQTEANLPEGIGKNVWNDEAGGAGGGSTGNWPGHGAVNVGIKHIQYNDLWGNRSNGFEAFNNKLQTYSEALEKPELEITEGDREAKDWQLHWKAIPLGVATIKGINVSFKAKDQGFGYKKSKIFLRIWRNETTKTEFSDYILTGGTLEHDWKEYNWDAGENQSIPIGAVAQLMCLVGKDGGHELYANDLKLILTMGPPQMATVNTIDFVQHGLVEKNTKSDQFIDLYDDVLSMSHDVKGVKVRFDAKDQGSGNLKGRVAMCVIKPSGEKKTILLHDGTIEHNWNSYEYNSANVMPFKIETGDEVKFMCVVGGGGGHKLFVKNLYAVLTFHETTRVFAPAQQVHNKNSIDSLIPLYEQKFPCGVSAVTKVKITLNAKDQGSGNLKGSIYMRLWENGCKNVISDILIAKISHEWKDYSYESDTIGGEIPPGSVIQFMIRVGGGGGHEMYVRNFVANITYIDSPRDETASGFNGEIRCVAKLKQLHVTGATSNVIVNVVKPNGSIRTTLPLDVSIHESTLISKVAIGDKLKFVPKSPGSHGSFQVTASFLPLEIPDHNSVVIHFAPRLDFYGFVHGYGPDNILTGDDHRLELKQKLRAVTVSCNWTDDNPDYHSTGKLYLVLRTKEGGEKGRYDVFGTVTHDWNHMMRVFASDDDLVKDAQPGDHFVLLREVGENGVLHIDDLDMYLMLSD